MQYKRPWLWLLDLAPRQQLQLPLWLYALLGIPKTRISEYQLLQFDFSANEPLLAREAKLLAGEASAKCDFEL
jgi:hypothetical protein